MKKPTNIILIRHGESEGNVNKDIYKDKPDFALKLTDRGKEQAFKAGEELSKKIGTTATFYVSPYYRTRQTSLEFAKSITPFKTYEDPRLREQEWLTNLHDVHDFKKLEKSRDSYGHFYWRFPNGESCADCFDRVSEFLPTLYRDFKKPDFPDNVLIFTHGMLMRLFIMRWFHLTVEEFELLKNPKNCGNYHLQLQENGKYKNISEVLTYKEPSHPYQFES